MRRLFKNILAATVGIAGLLLVGAICVMFALIGNAIGGLVGVAVGLILALILSIGMAFTLMGAEL